MHERWLIVGSGVSGLAAAKLLRSKGFDVLLSDVKPLSENVKQQLDNIGIAYVVGPQTEDLLQPKTNGIILSPGVPPEIPLIQSARTKKIPILSDIDLALREFRGDVIGITGTNGKSTTTVMCAHILNGVGKKSFAGGNLGVSPCDVVLAGERNDVWVLELSSYQLELSNNIQAKVGIFTSFSHDHLTRHKSLKNYFTAKWKLFTTLSSAGIAIMNEEILQLAQDFRCQLNDTQRQLRLVTEKDLLAFSPTEYPICTKHDQWNATYALIASGFILGKTPESLRTALRDFAPLPYRFQKVGKINGHQVINDSKSTNVESTLKALENISRPCVLLLGGISKDESFSPLATFSDRIKKVVCFGKSGQEIAAQLQGKLPLTVYQTLREALDNSSSWLSSDTGDILFSPACASFDEFKNFEHRGQFFNETLLKLTSKP